jgi:DNA replication protein DnaC
VLDDSPCEGCNSAGFRLTQTEGAGVLEPCEAFFARQRVELYNRALVPARFSSASFDSFDIGGGAHTDLIDAHRESYAWACAYEAGNPEGRAGLLFSGPPGVGKTHLSVAVLRYLSLELGVRCAFIDHVELVQRIKAGWDEGHGSSGLLEELATVEVLLIDDLGQGMATEWNRNLIDTLVSRRYNGGLATVATTNFPYSVGGTATAGMRRESLGDRVGDRVASRLTGGACCLRIEAPDYRKRSD